jgi:hypothetical protein
MPKVIWRFVVKALAVRPWVNFGVVPILCAHTATLPLARSKDVADESASMITTRFVFGGRDTAAFVVATIVLCIFECACLWWIPRTTCALKWKPTLVPAIALLLQVVSAFNCIVCGACVFLVFSQGYPSSNTAGIAGSAYYRNVETYSEHAWMLMLMAACRIAYRMTVRTTAENQDVHRHDDDVDDDNDDGEKAGRVQKVAKKVGTVVLFCGAYAAFCISLAMTGAKENVVMNTWVTPEQRVSQWIMFLLLYASAAGWADARYMDGSRPLARVLRPPSLHGASQEGTGPSPWWWWEPIVRAFAIGMAMLAFRLHDGDAEVDFTEQSRAGNTLDFFSLRRWGSMRHASGTSSHAQRMLQGMVQIWMALLVGLWFSECMRLLRKVR